MILLQPLGVNSWLAIKYPFISGGLNLCKGVASCDAFVLQTFFDTSEVGLCLQLRIRAASKCRCVADIGS